MVILFPFLQNIRRNMADSREGRDPVTLERILIPKPRFELVDGKLELRNVPVPAERIRMDENDMGSLAGSDVDRSFKGKLKYTLSRWPFAQPVKKIVYGLIGWEPFPEYRNPSSPAWQLMEAICRRFKELAGDKPFVIVPTFYSNYTSLNMARNYWTRFSSLTATPGIFAIDLLPYFKKLGREAERAFLEPHDMHFSAYGHLVLADALQAELTRLKLLPNAGTSAM